MQIVYWGNELQLGYFKHPPLISWITESVIFLFGNNEIFIYFTSEIMMIVAFLFSYRVSRKYLSPTQATMAITALPTMAYYSYLLPHLNHNIILIPFWALTIYLAYEAIEERKKAAWIRLGLCIGFGILSKYTILIMPVIILAYIVATPAHHTLLRQRELWLGVAVCLLVVTPHLIWLVRNDFPTLHYLVSSSIEAGEDSWVLGHLLNPLEGLLKILGMCASLALAIIGGLGRPRRQLGRLRSRDRFLLFMTLGPVLLVIALSFLTGGGIRHEWVLPFFVTLPTLILLLFYPEPTAREVRRFRVWVSGVSLAMIGVFLAIYSGALSLATEAEWVRFPARDLAAGVSEGWQTVCRGPVPVVIGDSWLAGTAAYGLPERPRVYAEADQTMAPWLTDQAIRETGAVIVWEADHKGRFREMDHMDEVAADRPADWFPGIPALEARFGTLVRLHDIVLEYPALTGLEPVRLSRAVIPPSRPCPEVIAAK